MTEMLQMNGDNGPVTLTRVGDYAQLKIEIADGPVVNINMDPESCRALARVSLSIAGAIDAEARPRAPVQGDNHAHFRPGNPHRVKWAAENGREHAARNHRLGGAP